MGDALRRHWPEYPCEAAGLGLFMVSATAFAVLLFHPASVLGPGEPFTRRALGAAEVHRALRRPVSCAKLHHTTRVRCIFCASALATRAPTRIQTSQQSIVARTTLAHHHGEVL
jgi:hypothetical protein